MDKIKERIEKLRIESDTNLQRAEKAEDDVKELKAELQRRENEVQSLNNKITLLTLDLERAEGRIAEVKIKKSEGDKEESLVDAMTRKVQMLESHLEEKERSLREATDKARNYELESEKFERKAKQLDAEKLGLEKTVEDLTAKYNVVKAELESTLKGLEDL